jgi:hypothetical protein
MSPDWVSDPTKEPVPTDDELSEFCVAELGVPVDVDGYQVVVGVGYESAVVAINRMLAVTRFLAGDFRCDHDIPVVISEHVLADLANDTLATLGEMDLADDLKAQVSVARFFLSRWVNGPDDPHDDGDDGDGELVPAP